MINRRTFLATVSAAAVSRTTSTLAQTPRLETLTDWVNASRDMRARALQPTLARIAATDTAIQAWKQVSPQRPTGDGPLAEIPFGAKDIMETRGLSTEYGSAIYRGRIGTVDADIVLRIALNPGGTHNVDLEPTTIAVGGGRFRVAYTPNGSISFSGLYNGEYLETTVTDTFDEDDLRTIDITLEATSGTKPTGRVRHLFEYVH